MGSGLFNKINWMCSMHASHAACGCGWISSIVPYHKQINPKFHILYHYGLCKGIVGRRKPCWWFLFSLFPKRKHAYLGNKGTIIWAVKKTVGNVFHCSPLFFPYIICTLDHQPNSSSFMENPKSKFERKWYFYYKGTWAEEIRKNKEVIKIRDSP